MYTHTHTHRSVDSAFIFRPLLAVYIVTAAGMCGERGAVKRACVWARPEACADKYSRRGGSLNTRLLSAVMDGCR